MEKYILQTKQLMKLWLELPNNPTEHSDYRRDFVFPPPKARPSDFLPPVGRAIRGYFEWNFRTKEWDIVIEV
jgi:hypothetical protein